MHLDVAGHPLHTRALTVTFTQRTDGRLDARAVLIDLRKRGLVPVGGDLQSPGIIHHMLLDGIVDPAAARLDEIRALQPAVAFEPSALTGGESCRDPIDRIAALAGSRLDAGFARDVSAAVGGPRGCSHILTLAHLLGSTAVAAIASPAPPPSAYAPGERVFRRDLIVDGHETAAGRLLLAVQLADLRLAAAPPVARPMERFAHQVEVRLLAEVELTRFALGRVTGAERRRGPADLRDAPWRAHDELLGPLAGLGLGAGITATLLERIGTAPERRPLLDSLLMLAPTLVQCMAALSETWPLAAQRSDSRVGIGGLPDSCYMWRRGGALGRAQEAEAAAAPRRG